jgi:hypothetical protein
MEPPIQTEYLRSGGAKILTYQKYKSVRFRVEMRSVLPACFATSVYQRVGPTSPRHMLLTDEDDVSTLAVSNL